MRKDKTAAPTHGDGGGGPAAVSVGRTQEVSTAKPWSGAQSKVQSGIDSSPRQLAQRRHINSVFGSAALQPKGERPPRGAGLPEPLKSGIESLSGLSMEDVRVHHDSTQPAQIGALAHAQGNNIHLGPGQEQHLPHEAWHVVQQAQGRVKPTMRMGPNVPVNDDPQLEAEADLMGLKAAQMRHSDQRPGLGAYSEMGTRPVMQQKVLSFDFESKNKTPPGADLTNELDSNDFSDFEGKASDHKKLLKKHPQLFNSRSTALLAPTKITARLQGSKTDGLSRNYYFSRVIGNIGNDEFFVRRGIHSESHEGGHLIPHALWSSDDKDKNFADGYENLVPMSRSVNVSAWSKSEGEITKKLAKMKPPDFLEWTIDIDRSTYKISVGDVAKHMGLKLKPKVDENKQAGRLWEWIPTQIRSAWKHFGEDSDDELSDREQTPTKDNALRTFAKNASIDSWSDLIVTLKSKGVWSTLSESLRQEILSQKDT